MGDRIGSMGTKARCPFCGGYRLFAVSHSTIDHSLGWLHGKRLIPGGHHLQEKCEKAWSTTCRRREWQNAILTE